MGALSIQLDIVSGVVGLCCFAIKLEYESKTYLRLKMMRVIGGDCQRW